MVGLFWVASVAPSYSTLVAPGAMNAINTVSNFLHGFVVPISAGMLSLASVGIIAGMDPETQHMLETIHLFGTGESFSGTGLIIAGGSATAAVGLTMAKAVAKPGLSLMTGTAGTISAPIYATLENLASVVMMGLFYVLANTNPWLLIALFVFITVITLVLLGYSLYLLWKLGKGIGQLIRLIQYHPKAGWAVVTEFFVWGFGWITWQHHQRGGLMLVCWLVFGLLWWVFFTISLLLPVLLVMFLPVSLMMFAMIGLFSARALMRKFDIPDAPPPSDLIGLPAAT
ncbi:MAG: hypothetical protein KDJ65_09820 [Anaerolineae bacterium]|nr:hypothetical protein [Anaerolineae bacterium]